eukprot:GGOE01008176.1.p1 GENE.GGOE01008176.1~~GGOE01008176.1.p1  ORF type:complete len:836 (-),score=185.09 GGOE01008176.1:94-2559(-)
MVAASHLSTLLNALYAADTPSDRRAAIQTELEAIRRDGPRHWTEWIMVESDYVKFFALNVLSDMVAKGRWPNQPREQRENVKNFLFSTLRERYPKAETFVARKMVATLVAIAKVEWPVEWPDFLPAVHSCFSSTPTVALGLGFLLQISEEFVAAQDLPSSRRDRLRADLLAVVPNILQQLLATLQQVLRGLEEQHSDDSSRIAVAAVGCLASYLSWLPRDALPPPTFALLPVLEACLGAAEPLVRTEALGVIYDVFSVPYISPGSPTAVLFEGCVRLLSQQLMSFSQLTPTLQAHEAYTQKLAVCSGALLTSHIPRLHTEPGGLLMELLQAALSFTASQCTLSGYEEALAVWPPFVSWLEDQKGNCSARHYAGAADVAVRALEMFGPLSASLLNLLLDRALCLIGRLASVCRDTALIAPQPAGPGLGMLGHRLARVLQGWSTAGKDKSLWMQDTQTLLAVFCHVSYEAEQHFDLLFPMVSSLFSATFSIVGHLLEAGRWGEGAAALNCSVQCLHLLLAYSHWLCQFQEWAGSGPPGQDMVAFQAVLEEVLRLSVLPMELAHSSPVEPAILATAAQLLAEVCSFVPAATLLRLPCIGALVNPQMGSALYLHALHLHCRSVPQEAWVELRKATACVLLGPMPAQEHEARVAQEALLSRFLADLLQLLESVLRPVQDISANLLLTCNGQPADTALRECYALLETRGVVDHALGVLNSLLGSVACASHAVRLALHRHLHSFYPLLITLCRHVLLLRLWAAPESDRCFVCTLMKGKHWEDGFFQHPGDLGAMKQEQCSAHFGPQQPLVLFGGCALSGPFANRWMDG